MIKPEEIPQFTGNLELLEQDYAALKADAGHVRDTGRDVHNRFQGLSAYYTAPEAEQLFATTKPVKDRADSFADGLETVSGALAGYATEIRPLVKKLEQLKQEATTFVDSVKGDDDWEYDGDKVAHHNRIRDEVTRTVAAFWAAERTCHNKITALWHGTQMVAGDGSDKKNQYGFDAEDLKNAKLPWGDPVEEKHHWYEVGHWVKSFVWDGLIVDGVWGTIKGLGTLVGFGGWEAMGQAWKGLAQLATGLAISSIPGVGAMFWALPDDKLPSWIRDSRTAMKETGKALVAWDEWGKNPARAAGAVTFNVLTTVFTGGAGGAASGAGKAGAVAKVLSAAGKAGKVIDPMTYVSKAAGAGLSKIGDIAKGLKGIGKIDIPKLPDNAITLPEGSLKLPDGTVHLPEGAPIPEGATKLPNGTIELPHDTPVLPEGTTKLPSVDGSPAQYMDPHGNLLDHQGNLVQHADQAPTDIVDKPHPDADTPATGADTPHTPSPAKEPALVGAGTHTAEQAGEHIRLGDSTGGDLGDVGRTADTGAVHVGSDVPTVHAGGDHVPTVHAGGGDGLPGGRHTTEHVPGGHAGDHLPGGSAHEHGAGPSASHEAPSGGTDERTDAPGSGGHESHSSGQSGSETSGGNSESTTGSGDTVGAHNGVEGHDADGLIGSDGPSGIRENQPLPELTPEEKAAHWEHLDEVERRHPEDFDQMQRDPDKNGGISEPSKDEARVGLDLREQGRLPDDIRRPPAPDMGEFYSPSTGQHYDIKGVHSDWPPFNNVRDKSQPFRGAYNPAKNQRWVNKLAEQIVDKGRTVILDVRNANQAAIDDIKSIVEKNGWEDNVIWYP
ncbi:hypothetical protein [Streptomyces mexicanus]|uniref:hypothetical protein n=1 Tax=Streptomyces mexicanus TaxID=178566 RepID=UPI00365FDF81